MLDAIKKFVNRHMVPESEAVPSTAADGEAPAAPDSVRIAACALLLEVAHADREFSPSEQAHIEEALGRHFDLDETMLNELLELAETERRQSIDHFQFTRLINEHYDLGQKMVLAELMWGVVLADGQVAKHESYLVRKLANLLDLEPAYLAQARRRATPES